MTNLRKLFIHRSGNFDHKGRPGLVGGSAPSNSPKSDYDTVVEVLKKQGSKVDLLEQQRQNRKPIPPNFRGNRFSRARDVPTGAYWIFKDGSAIRLINTLHEESAKEALEAIGSESWDVMNGHIGGLVKETGIVRLHVTRGEWAINIPATGITNSQFRLLEDLYNGKSPYTEVRIENVPGHKRINPDNVFNR